MNWISVKHRLPVVEENLYHTRVIVFGSPTCGTHGSDWEVMEANYSERDGFYYGEYDCFIEVSHWMPLPPVPKKPKDG